MGLCQQMFGCKDVLLVRIEEEQLIFLVSTSNPVVNYLLIICELYQMGFYIQRIPSYCIEWWVELSVSNVELIKSILLSMEKLWLCIHESSVSNSSGRSLLVRVQTELLPNWRSGLSIYPDHWLGYISMVHFQPVRIQQVVSGSPSASIHRLNQATCFSSILTVSYQNRVSNSQGFVFACFAACNFDYFGIGVLPLIDCIFAYQGSR